ncbi:MAG TPA: hypothetical protein VGQ81_10795 [Acidobacteriota bacterium]|nr:hypothetical protein [Acidobacteriota bacterium]
MRKQISGSSLALLCFLLLAFTAVGIAADGKIDASLLRNLPWRNVGPAIMGGRIDDFAVVENQPNIVYVATASGGLFKTTNAGITWEALFDAQPTSTIGDIAIAPSNPSIIWVGTGEANNRQSSSWGNGVYKSTDGGKTWASTGLADTMHIGRVIIDPLNPDIVYVAAAGHLWGPNKERGLYKTTDGGKSWTNTLFVNEDTGFIDVAIDPESPNILYAAAYQRRRTPFGFNGGGPGSGLYRTIDAGATWKKLTEGLPKGDTGRIGIDIYRKNPSIVYAVIENAKGGVFRSDDRGETWKKMSDTNPRPAYYSNIRIDPNNDQRIWVLGANMYVSEDGGKTFQTNVVSKIHGDYHALWINPADSNHMLTGSDGGIHWSYDRGRSWDFVNAIPLGQFYEVTYDMRKPFWVYGGLQDNGSWGGPSSTLYQQGISNEDWIRVGGGDGFYVQVDPTDANIIYSESQNGNAGRLHMSNGERKNIKPRPPAGEKQYRFDWNTPILISPHDPKKLYLGGNRLFISTDRGDTWRRTEDLTTSPDRDKMPIMGVVPNRETLSRHDGQETFGQIVTVSESPMRAGLLYVGTDDGNLQISRDDGKTWKNLTGRVPAVPKGTYVSRVVASRFAEGRAYATFDGHRGNDFKLHLYVTENFGDSWKSISANLPEGSTLHVVREHFQNPNLLFAGTERGAYVSFDRGGQWVRMEGNLPIVPVDDMQIHPRDNALIVGTHGRSIWILDDLTPLEQMSERILQSNLYLFDIQPAVSYRIYGHKGSTGHKAFIAPNAPAGVAIQYFLKNKLSENETVKIAVLDKEGKVVRELENNPKASGLNRQVWDLRYSPPFTRDESGTRGGGGFFGPPRGPRALPGEYTLQVKLGNEQQTKTVRVEDDPRVIASDADRRAQLDALIQINKLQKTVEDARVSLENSKTQLDTLQKSLKKQNSPKALQDSVEALINKINDIQGRLVPGQRDQESAGPEFLDTPRPLSNRVNLLAFSIDGYTEAPASSDLQEINELRKALNGLLGEVNDVLEKSIADLNRQLRESQVPYVNPGSRIAPPE